MRSSEIANILMAVIVLFAVLVVPFVNNSYWDSIHLVFLFSVIIFSVTILAKKVSAYLLDMDVEHEIWRSTSFNLIKKNNRVKEIELGLILPLFLAVLGIIFSAALQFMAILTYEARALKHRAAKRFGVYSYAEVSEWHNALIGVAGIISLLFLSVIAYLVNLEYLAAASTFYAFWNLLPISKLDGSQIFFGSRVIYSVLAVLVLIFTAYALFL